MDASVITEMAHALSKCGRPMLPTKQPYVPWPRGMVLQASLPASPPQTLEFQKVVDGPTTWQWTDTQFSFGPATALYIQVKMPNGRMLFNNLVDVTQIAGYGSWRYVFDEPLDCPPGSIITLTLDTTITQPGTIQPETA